MCDISASLGLPFSEMPIRPVRKMWSEWCRFLCPQRCVVLHKRQSLSRRIARCLLPTHLVLHSRCAIIAVLASNRWLFVWVIARTLHLMFKRKCIKYSTSKKLVYLRSLKLYIHKDPWRNISRDCPYVRKCRTARLNNLLKTLVVGVVL